MRFDADGYTVTLLVSLPDNGARHFAMRSRRRAAGLEGSQNVCEGRFRRRERCGRGISRQFQGASSFALRLDVPRIPGRARSDQSFLPWFRNRRSSLRESWHGVSRTVTASSGQLFWMDGAGDGNRIVSKFLSLAETRCYQPLRESIVAKYCQRTKVSRSSTKVGWPRPISGAY